MRSSNGDQVRYLGLRLSNEHEMPLWRPRSLDATALDQSRRRFPDRGQRFDKLPSRSRYWLRANFDPLDLPTQDL